MLSGRLLPILLTLLLASACGADWNVRDFGAAGDGATDDTPAFQNALNEAGQAGGGIVNVPAGTYRINGNLVIPGAVTLQGILRVPPVVVGARITGVQGSILHAYAGRGSEEGEPFIKLDGNAATVAGLTIVYPEWKQTDVPPVPYPPCISARQHVENVGVLDCNLVNPYEGIKFVFAARHLIRNVYGYPIKRGIYIDECYDIGRIENIHFWPFGVHYKHDDPYCKWINVNGVSMEFARTDWHYVTNTFCFGYGVGYKFSETKAGSANGNFLGIGADSCRRAVLVEQCQGPGLLITNGEFVGRWGSGDSVCLEIGEKVSGKVQLSNCSFWGPIDRCVWMRGDSAHFIATACNFLNWDNSALSNPALDIQAGKAIVQGCSFGEGALNARVGAKVRSAIFIGNQASDGFAIENGAGKRTQSIGNEQETVQWTDDARLHYRIDIGTAGDKRYVRSFHGQETMPWKGRSRHSRWSGEVSELILPVAPGKQYALSLDLSLPEYAISSDMGLYLGDRRIAAFAAKPDESLTVSAVIPPQNSDKVTLTLRVKGWVPMNAMEGNRDSRTLGARTYSVIMRASGAKGRIFSANTGEWTGP